MGWREPLGQRGYISFDGGNKWDTWDRGKAFGQRGQNGIGGIDFMEGTHGMEGTNRMDGTHRMEGHIGWREHIS